MDKVSIVMPAYNGWDLVKRNVDSLIKYDKERIFEIIIVDDCSPVSNTFKYDSEYVTIQRNSHNLGYAGTVNAGLKSASCEIILLLDSDAFLLSPILSRLITIFKEDINVGCIGFGAVNENGKPTGSYQYYPTVTGYILGQRLEAKMEKAFKQKKSLILPLSCCVSFRKACLEDVAYFDDITFPVLEADNDLSMRIHRSEWKIVYKNDIIVCHEGGNSYKVDSKRVRMLHAAKWKLFKKHNMIKNSALTRTLLSLRIYSEIAFMKLSQLNSKNDVFLQKIQGRKDLLNDLKTYR